MKPDLSSYWIAAGMTGPVPEPTAFGDSVEQQDDLCALILSGPKRATASLARWYDPISAPRPRPGDRFIIVDSSGTPRGIIETTHVDEVGFGEVNPEFARHEGEGDGSLSYWRAEHRRFFTLELGRKGLTFDEGERVVCERFSLVYP